MSDLARITVRLMDRTRSIDVFAMAQVVDAAADICLQAGSFAHVLSCDLEGCPDSGAVAALAISAAVEIAPETGFSIRSVLIDGWLLSVRIDRRTRTIVSATSATTEPADYAMAA